MQQQQQQLAAAAADSRLVTALLAGQHRLCALPFHW